MRRFKREIRFGLIGSVAVVTGLAGVLTFAAEAGAKPPKTTTTTAPTTTTVPPTTTTAPSTVPCTPAPASVTTGSATLTLTPATCLNGGTPIAATGTGFDAGKLGTFVQCSNAPGQPRSLFRLLSARRWTYRALESSLRRPSPFRRPVTSRRPTSPSPGRPVRLVVLDTFQPHVPPRTAPAEIRQLTRPTTRVRPHLRSSRRATAARLPSATRVAPLSIVPISYVQDAVAGGGGGGARPRRRPPRPRPPARRVARLRRPPQPRRPPPAAGAWPSRVPAPGSTSSAPPA